MHIVHQHCTRSMMENRCFPFTAVLWWMSHESPHSGPIRTGTGGMAQRSHRERRRSGCPAGPRASSKHQWASLSSHVRWRYDFLSLLRLLWEQRGPRWSAFWTRMHYPNVSVREEQGWKSAPTNDLLLTPAQRPCSSPWFSFIPRVVLKQTQGSCVL